MNFSKITLQEIQKYFDIEEIDNQDIFQDWFHFKYDFNDEENRLFEKLIKRYRISISDFNEEDIKLKILAPLFYSIDFYIQEKQIQEWYDVPLSYGEFSGRADFVIAKGVKYPQKPYFFIQKFKKSIESTNPEYQLLAEMLVAMKLNNTDTIYGAFIIGQYWKFMIVKDSKYFVSQSFDSMKIDDLKVIYKNLVAIKEYIKEDKI
jgi:hypothetical protein